MEAKWGCDRLRLLVGPELREKFDRQRYLLNQAIWHGDLEAVRRHLQSIEVVCRGGAAAGQIGGLSKRERFDWLVAPRSTMIQMSAVHSGRGDDMGAVLEHLLQKMVR